VWLLDQHQHGPAEIAAYTARLRDILDGGGRIRLVQVHTIARSPLSPSASTLPDDVLDAIADAKPQS